MSHNIETMFSGRGITPWHKLGTIVEGTPDSAEAIRLAGLDWQVEKHPLFARIPTGKDTHGKEAGIFKRADSMFGTVRRDTNKVLGIVGGGYTVVQNAEVFGMLDSLVHDGAAQYETAGSLGGGETVWMLLNAGDIKVAGDQVRPYFLATTTHDGSGRLRVRNVATRVVCANTLACAMGEHVTREFVAGHTRSVHDRMKQAESLLGIMRETTAAFAATAEALAAQTFSAADWGRLVAALVPCPDDSDPNTTTKQMNNWARKTAALVQCLGVPDLANIRGTAWGALNAVADFEQHHLRVTGDDEKRLETLFKRSFLEGDLTRKAFALVTA
jgi:phage/plasmid-like protein (TIGR03299 family)